MDPALIICLIVGFTMLGIIFFATYLLERKVAGKKTVFGKCQK